MWFHCASVGELEQARPLIDAIKVHYPAHLVAVSIFSPSVYLSAQKNRQLDLVTYLPLDTKKNAQAFIKILEPELVIFIKYEYWYHHLSAVRTAKIPLLLVSSIFRSKQIFFKFYGGFYRRMLSLYTAIFLQDRDSQKLLHTLNLPHKEHKSTSEEAEPNTIIVAGDTRFDRVKEIAGAEAGLPLIENFCANIVTVIAGSTWPDDEDLLARYQPDDGIKMIIAPHEINHEHITQIQQKFNNSVLYSELQTQQKTDGRVLVIDNIGMLSRLYRFADVCYIGGGFNKSGIHNTLEAAVYGKPLIFGPHYQKFKEARDLIRLKAAFSVTDRKQLDEVLSLLLNDVDVRNSAGSVAGSYVKDNTGATARVLDYIQANRLLTN